MESNKSDIPKELLEKAMQCKTAEELIALARENGFELTQEEAEAYLGETSPAPLKEEQLEGVAGAGGWDCNDYGQCGVPFWR